MRRKERLKKRNPNVLCSLIVAVGCGVSVSVCVVGFWFIGLMGFGIYWVLFMAFFDPLSSKKKFPFFGIAIRT